jgi:molybdate transport system substrate-binding protein
MWSLKNRKNFEETEIMLKFTRFVTICGLVLLLAAPAFAKEKVYIFAAASTTNVVKALLETYQQESSPDAEFLTSFASSSTLARQIEAGADADLYISANVKWFNWLEERGMVEPDSGSIMAANSLVLIAPAGSDAVLSDPAKLPQLLGDSYLAMGDVSHVPAGMYGKEVLDYYGLWEQIGKQVAQYATVRVALNAVEKQQTDLGIVYKTDALQAKNVDVVYTFAAESHTPVEYPLCAIKGQLSAAAQDFLDFMKTAKAKEILEQYGFAAR